MVQAVWGQFFSMGSIAWNGVISYNLIVNLRNPFVNSASYGKFYHLFVWTMCAGTAALFPIFNIAGPSGDNTCWFANDKPWQWRLLFYGPLLVFWCVSIVALVVGLLSLRRVMYNARSRRIIIRRMVAFTFVFIFLLMGSLVHRLIQLVNDGDMTVVDCNEDDNVWTIQCAFLLWDAWSSVSVGWANSLVWISNPLFWTHLQRNVFRPFFRRVAPRSWLVEHATDDDVVPRVLDSQTQYSSTLSTTPAAAPHSDELRTSERMPLISQVSRMLSYVNDQDDFTMVDHQLRKRIIRCLLHGICQRNAASSEQADRGHLLYNFEDFETVYVAVGDPADNPDRVKYRFCEYAPMVFGAVRELCGVDDAHFKSAFDPQQFFANPANLKFSDGRSGSFFGFSPDRRFIIKTVDEAEFDLLLKSLPAYCRHLKAHPASLVVRFYGLYSLTVKGFTDLATLRCIAMSNVFHLPSAAVIEEQYDLKGSWVQRHAPEHDSNRAALGLDVDLLRNLDLNEEDRKAFVDQAAYDTDFLSSLDIMDYSLLLGFVPLTPELAAQISLDDVPTRASSSDGRKRLKRPTPLATSAPLVDIESDGHARSVPLSSPATAMYNLRSSDDAVADVSVLRGAVSVGIARDDDNDDNDNDDEDVLLVSTNSANHANVNSSSDARSNNNSHPDIDVDCASGIADCPPVEFTVGAHRSRNGRWLLRSRDGNTLYAFGIIDMLQLYNTGKKLERFFKINLLCKDRDGVSVQNPLRYAKRFLFRMSTLSTGRVRPSSEYQELARRSISSATSLRSSVGLSDQSGQ